MRNEFKVWPFLGKSGKNSTQWTSHTKNICMMQHLPTEDQKKQFVCRNYTGCLELVAQKNYPVSCYSLTGYKISEQARYVWVKYWEANSSLKRFSQLTQNLFHLEWSSYQGFHPAWEIYTYCHVIGKTILSKVKGPVKPMSPWWFQSSGHYPHPGTRILLENGFRWLELFIFTAQLSAKMIQRINAPE